MNSQLQKAFNLAKKTGDRLIVFEGPKSDNGYVVMGLEDYEKLTIGKSDVRDLTEDELLDKINRDIAIWKSEQDFLNLSQDTFSDFESREQGDRDIESIKSDIKRRNTWAIPNDRKQGAEEIIEEDQQYLEEIKF